MGSPNQLTYRDAAKILKRNGFVQVRSKNHQIFRRGEQTFTIHSSGNLNPWLSAQIMKLERESKVAV